MNYKHEPKKHFIFLHYVIIINHYYYYYIMKLYMGNNK